MHASQDVVVYLGLVTGALVGGESLGKIDKSFSLFLMS